MNKSPQPSSPGIGGRLFAAYAVILILLGATLAYPGIQLLSAGGSAYYALMGAALIAAGVLFLRRRRAGLWVFGAASLATFAWAIAESGGNGWGYVPRLAWLIAVSAVLLMFYKVALRRIPALDRRVYLAVTGALPLVMLATILVPLFFPRTAQLADAELARQRPATPFSRAAVPSPDGNVAGSHDDTSWTSYAGSNLGMHYSPAAQITPANVGKLEKVWEYHHGDLKPKGAKIAYLNESTPLKVGNSLYTCTPTQIIVSIDAASGKENWRYDSKVDPTYLKGGGANCRGVAYYEVPDAREAFCGQRIIWGTTDVRLGAVDARTGQACTGFGDGGFADLKPGLGNFRPGSTAITTAPTIVRGSVVTGAQVIDSDVRPAPSGVVRGFDAVTGKLKWAWDVGRPGVTTAPPEGENYTDSTPNSWAPLAADDELGLVYVTTGNSAGDFYGGTRRPFDDEFTDSLVAIDADTGEVKWHFRTVNHDLWDYDLSPTPALVDFPGDNGSVRPAVIQATKSGQIFVLDRRTGEPIMPVTQMPVPQGTAEGDWTAATQPMSLAMPNTMGRPGKTHEVLTEASTWGLTPWDQMACRMDFVQARYEGLFTPPVADRESLIYPGHHGGLNWGGVMVDPARGLLIVNNQRLPYMEGAVSRARLDAAGSKSFQETPGQYKGFRPQAGQPFGATKGPWMSPLGQPCIAPPWGFISGIDLRTQEVIWSRPFGTGYDTGPMGIPSRTHFEIGTPSDATGVVTAGGVTIIGAALDQTMRAYDSQSGELLWQTRLPAGNQAAPLSYVIDGRQYVVAVVGGHDRIPTKLGDSIIAWALPAGEGR